MKKYAEALIECGYADEYGSTKTEAGEIIAWWVGRSYIHDDRERNQYVRPFSDTLEGRRQSDALEDWLMHKYTHIWNESDNGVYWLRMRYRVDNNTAHQWRLRRIKWCFEQLEEEK